MIQDLMISGFSDEISSDFDTQLEVVSNLGMKYISLRGIDGKNIRIFSFYIPKGEDPDQYKEEVISKLKEFAAIAEKHNVILLHENEKDIFGDIGRRCHEILTEVGSPYFKGIFDFAN